MRKYIARCKINLINLIFDKFITIAKQTKNFKIFKLDVSINQNANYHFQKKKFVSFLKVFTKSLKNR